MHTAQILNTSTGIDVTLSMAETSVR